MDTQTMSNEENYRFDVAGYLVIPGVLTAAELKACNRALDQRDSSNGALRWTGPADNPLVALREHPVLTGYLRQFCGEGFRLDESLRLLGDCAEAKPLTGGGEWIDWSRAYRQHNGDRFCQGVRVYWALAEVGPGDGGLVVVPASHNSTVDAPRDLVDGTDDMGLLEQPVLQAGDLMICAESLMRGLQPVPGTATQRLLECTYISAGVRPGMESEIDGAGDEMPEWTAELTELERAVLHNPGRSQPFPVVHSDGQQVRLAEESEVFHPSIYIRDPDSGIDEKEFYYWDLNGHLVLRGVMDEAWLKAANEAIDANPERIQTGGPVAAEETPLGSKGVPRSSMADPWALPAPHGESFQRMIADPILIQRLNWMMGSGYECMLGSGLLLAKGSAGHRLHSPAAPARVNNHYRQQNGRVYTDYVNVAWQLRDVTREDGGFVCVPGSHKTVYPMPEGIRTCENEMGLVKHVAMKAGDVLFFLGATQGHGAYPWMGEEDRRMILFQYRSRNLYAP